MTLWISSITSSGQGNSWSGSHRSKSEMINWQTCPRCSWCSLVIAKYHGIWKPWKPCGNHMKSPFQHCLSPFQQGTMSLLNLPPFLSGSGHKFQHLHGFQAAFEANQADFGELVHQIITWRTILIGSCWSCWILLVGSTVYSIYVICDDPFCLNRVSKNFLILHPT